VLKPKQDSIYGGHGGDWKCTGELTQEIQTRTGELLKQEVQTDLGELKGRLICTEVGEHWQRQSGSRTNSDTDIP